MGLSNDFLSYGIHSSVPYRRSDKLPYGIFKILAGGTISLSAEFEDLFGGSNKYAWASEAKTISSEYVATVKSLPDFLFELFLAAEVTTTAASATGTITALVAGKGTLVDAVGLASVGIESGEEAELKTGLYVVKAVSATTVDVYCLTDIDFSNGTDISYKTDDLEITASALTISTGAAVSVPNTGIELTGGSGTIDMTTGDTATFSVAPAHGGISTIVIGKSGANFTQHGQMALAAKQASGDILEINMHKVVGAGVPISLEETTFSSFELTSKLLFDNCLNRIITARKIKGLDSAC